MMSNFKLPKLVSVAKFCAANTKVKTQIALLEFERLAELAAVQDGVIDIELEFKQEYQRNLLLTNLKAEVIFTCQRCLDKVALNIGSQTKYLLVKSAALLNDAEFEVIIIDSELELYPLLEDELLLNIPASITHLECSLPEFATKEQQVIKPNPFAVLAKL